MPGKLTTTLIECQDFAAVTAFYAEKLELPVKRQAEGFRVFDAGDHDIVVWQGEKSEVVFSFTGLDLEVNRKALSAKGLTPSEIEEHPGGKHFYVTDPEGNTIMLSD